MRGVILTSLSQQATLLRFIRSGPQPGKYLEESIEIKGVRDTVLPPTGLISKLFLFIPGGDEKTVVFLVMESVFPFLNSVFVLAGINSDFPVSEVKRRLGPLFSMAKEPSSYKIQSYRAPVVLPLEKGVVSALFVAKPEDLLLVRVYLE